MAKALAKILPKSNFVKSVLTLMTGTTIAQAIPILVSFLLTRLYSPADFGVYALFMSLITVLSVIVTGKYELAIMLPDKEEDAINIVSLAMRITTFVSIIILLIVTVFNDEIIRLLNNEEISSWLYFVPLMILISGLYQIFNYWYNREKKYKNIANSKMVQAISTSTVNVIMGLGKFGASGLILGTIIGQGFGNGLLYKSYLEKRKKLKQAISVQRMKELAIRYKEFPQFTIWSSLLNTASLQVPVFMLTSYFDTSIVGFYSLSNRIINMPMAIIGGAIGQVFFQKASESKNDKNKLKELTLQVYKKLLYIGIIPISIIIGFGDYLFSIAFGSKWVTAGDYAQILGVWILFVFISSPVSNLFFVLEKQKQALYYNILIFSSRVFSIYIGAVFFKDAYIAIILFGVTGAVFWYAFSVYLLRLVKISYKESFIVTFPVIVVVLGIVLGIRYLIF